MRNSINIYKINRLLRVLCGYFLHYLTHRKENIMGKQFVYFYFMKNEPDNIQQVVPSHVSYWKNNHVEGYSGGPFTDRSGGLITFEANSIEDAEKLVYGDPFVIKDLLENKWIKEWMVE